LKEIRRKLEEKLEECFFLRDIEVIFMFQPENKTYLKFFIQMNFAKITMIISQEWCHAMAMAITFRRIEIGGSFRSKLPILEMLLVQVAAATSMNNWP
jgi:hypothetical protein